MIGLVFSGAALLGGVLLMLFNRHKVSKRDDRDWEDRSNAWYTGLVISILAGVLFFFSSLLPTGVAWNGQINDRAAISQYQANQQIYQRKAANLTAQLKGYLAVQYPKFEARIFKEIASNPKALFTFYPQLQSSTTIVALTNEITSLQNQVYDQETNITQAEKNIRVRRTNPWNLTFLLK